MVKAFSPSKLFLMKYYNKCLACRVNTDMCDSKSPKAAVTKIFLCGTGIPNPKYIQEECPFYTTEGSAVWPNATKLKDKLWESRNELERTALFPMDIKILV